MAVSYKKLWKLLIDKDIKKKDLSSMAGVSPATITKMGKNGHVTTEVLLKICTALECSIDDISGTYIYLFLVLCHRQNQKQPLHHLNKILQLVVYKPYFQGL